MLEITIHDMHCHITSCTLLLCFGLDCSYLLLVNKLGLKRGKNVRSYFIQGKERLEV